MQDRRASHFGSSNEDWERSIAFKVGGWGKPYRRASGVIRFKVKDIGDEDVVGEEVPKQRIRDLYGEDGHISFWNLARSVSERNGRGICVSYAEFSFEKEPDMRFYGVEKDKVGDGLKIVYLGKGKTPFTTEILNSYAAETWGIAVLKLLKTNEITDKKS